MGGGDGDLGGLRCCSVPWRTVGCTQEPVVLQTVTAATSRLRITCANAVSRTLGYACVPHISRARGGTRGLTLLLLTLLDTAGEESVIQLPKGQRSTQDLVVGFLTMSPRLVWSLLTLTRFSPLP